MQIVLHPPLDVTCPTCGKRPGEVCKADNGYTLWDKPHEARVRASREAHSPQAQSTADSAAELALPDVERHSSTEDTTTPKAARVRRVGRRSILK